jgi:hypothetical protein
MEHLRLVQQYPAAPPGSAHLPLGFNNIVPADIVGNKECRSTVMLRNIPNNPQSCSRNEVPAVIGKPIIHI